MRSARFGSTCLSASSKLTPGTAATRLATLRFQASSSSAAGTPLADDGNVLSFAARRTKLHQERLAKLHPARRSTLEMLKNSYPDESEEELLQEMIDWGF
jgi:hypothetical protein